MWLLYCSRFETCPYKYTTIHFCYAKIIQLCHNAPKLILVTISKKLVFNFPSEIFPHQILNVYFILSQT